MPSILRRALIAAFCCSSTACVSYTRPAVSLDSLTEQKKAAPSGSGYLAFTAGFDMKTFTGYPSVVFEITDSQTQATQDLRVSPEDMEAFGKGREWVPLVFVVPAGHYTVTRTLMSVPGGYVKGHRFDPADHLLSVEKELQPFTIDANKLTHLAVLHFSMTESNSAKYLYYYSQSSVDLRKPTAAAWEPYKSFLASTPAVYLKKTQMNTFSWPPMVLTAGAKEETEKEAAPLKGTSQMLSPDQVQKVTQSKRGEVGACHLQYSPKAKGRIEIKYVVAPDGKIHEAKLVSSTLKAPKTEGCILAVVKTLKFPKTPDDDFETWTLTWDFDAGK